MILKRNDIILIAAVIFIATIIQIYNSAKRVGSNVEIFVDGDLYGVYSLSESRTIEVINLNNNKNVVEISNTEVYMLDADCRDKICVRHSSISKSGASIICIPNRVSIKISGSSSGLDAVLR